jgi:HEAT repeat protein
MIENKDQYSVLMRFFICFFSFVSSLTFALEDSTNAQKRIKDHLIIKDYPSALHETKLSLAQFPQSKEIHSLMVRVLSESGDAIESYRYFKKASSYFPEMQGDFSLIESFCWAALQNAENSSQLVVNISSMIGASITHDAKAVKILSRHLKSSNAYLRMMAVKLSAQFGDLGLIEQIKALSKTEAVWYVRLEIIKALGRLKVNGSKEIFKEIITSKRSTLEEKAVSAQSLISSEDKIESQEILSLLKSSRAELRYLGCEILSYLNAKEFILDLAQLLQDHSKDVKIAALSTFYTIGIEKEHQGLLIEKIENLLTDPLEEVSLAAARVLSFYKEERALEFLEEKIFSSEKKIRSFAAASMASSSQKLKLRSLELMAESKDPFVRVNIAKGLLGHEIPKAPLTKEIESFLETYEDLIMEDGSLNPHLPILSPSSVRHIPGVAMYPEIVDLQTRFSLLNQLAICDHPNTEKALKDFLKKPIFGMTFFASNVLVQESSEDALTLIEKLLEEEDEMIKIQAALVLAFLSDDQRALDILYSSYYKVDREIKISILEALGHIGSKKSLPFLLQLLDDPFNIIKVIAASSIIQCIYH